MNFFEILIRRKKLERTKSTQYYSHLRQDLIDMIEGQRNKILDIGCGKGITGSELKRIGKAKEVVGVEKFEPAALEAKLKLDKVIVGDIQTELLPYTEGYFDYIILGDVLEHLLDPGDTLKKLKKYLSAKGFLIASIPNVSYWRILKDLIFFDKWEYVEEGILDKTHLRFFTKKSLIELFRESDLVIKDLIPNTSKRFISKLLIIFSLGLLNRFLTSGYLIKAARNTD
ncbi:MAG: hypothetical protein AMJ90_00390 [candidate division Zixibacteria bacterium SM23_73_2]|nr:MAG: hypothetical protein AMJ90_00390 [candidate division Zixibacteria bacterium SM23_73_2]